MIIYDDLSELLFSTFPELRVGSDELFGYMDEVTAYLVFESVFAERLASALNEPNSEERTRWLTTAFEFIERLAAHEEAVEEWWPRPLRASWKHRTKELVKVTILEWLLTRKTAVRDVAKALPYVGPETRQLLQTTAKSIGHLETLHTAVAEATA